MNQWTLRLMVATLLLLCACMGAIPAPSGQLITTSTAVNRQAGTSSSQSSQTGTLSICEETDGGLTGTFSISSSAFTETQTITVVAGASQPVCGPPIHIAAGMVAATEVAAPGTTLAGARTLPQGNFIRLTGSTATFTVIAGGLEAQTLIIFRNSPAAK